MAGKQRKKSNSERQQISHKYLSLKPLPNSSVVVYKESSTKRWRYFEIAPRSRLSRHERVWCGEIALRSRRGVDISTRYFEISPRWWLSRRGFADLGAILARLPQSHRGLLFSARYFEISPRSWLSRRSRRDCRDLTEVSVKFYKGSVLFGITLMFATGMNKSVNASLHDSGTLPRKGLIV